MTYRPLWSCTVALGLIALSEPAHAQNGRTQYSGGTPVGTAQVTFGVPVAVQGFSTDVTQAQVFCQADNTANAGPPAKGYTNVALSGGAYTGTVNVPVAFSVTQPGASWNYHCTLSFFNGKLNQWGLNNEAWVQPRNGTTPQLSTQGTVVVGASSSPATRQATTTFKKAS